MLHAGVFELISGTLAARAPLGVFEPVCVDLPRRQTDGLDDGSGADREPSTAEKERKRDAESRFYLSSHTPRIPKIRYWTEISNKIPLNRILVSLGTP